MPVLGRPMVAHLAELYRTTAARMVLVVAPDAADAAHEAAESLPLACEVTFQSAPTGMLDAILLARPNVEHAREGRIWITWCDQIAIAPASVGRVAVAGRERPDAAIILPTARRPNPYIHLDRDWTGRIVAVRHRREGDAMPAVGESDMGLFSLSRSAYLEALPAFAAVASTAAGTGERNFLPFIPWIAAREPVITVPCEDEREAVGVNTPEELALVEEYLKERAR